MAQTKEQNPSIPWVIRPPHAGHAATEEDEQEADGQSAFLGVSEWCDLLIIGWCGWSLSVGGCHRWDVLWNILFDHERGDSDAEPHIGTEEYIDVVLSVLRLQRGQALAVF
jgi:hypothetical protein